MCRELRKDVFASTSAQMKEKKRCKVDFLLHRFSTSFIAGFPHVSYGFFRTEWFVGAAPARQYGI
jgi:hypothetical protein